jgi:PspAA-like protein
MIVRISTEGQYELAEGDSAALNELDNAAVAASEAGDEAKFHETFARLLEFVRGNGRQVDDDHLGASDLILPPPDVSISEARAEFSGEGLLPN